MAPSYNLKSSAVKRILQEAKELDDDTAQHYKAHPLEDNIFEWHFTVAGPPDTEFHGGRYHGRILLPTEYPFKPPHLIFLTPNGRFQLNTKICLSITDHHPEFWQPAWGIRTVLLAIQSFFPTPGAGALGSLDCSQEERRIYAKKSKTWQCETCQRTNHEMIPDISSCRSSSAPVDLSMFTLTTPPSNVTSSSTNALPRNPSPQPDVASLASPSSHSSTPTRHNHDHPPSTFWVDAFIAVLITLLLFMVARKFL
ncbi:UBC-like protein [Hesseltinella vesiculosa]|uniref:UBC-like protein n=1 Tax=Hesseltinella vesiculosa TaxID=101127 RepID=A0A1X2G4D5_9FUNG|nr:UBC-like protein [Hesseltinella vesiculosa]